MKVVPLMIALVLTLTGCDTAEAETLVPGVTPDSPDINFGQIPGGLPAGFYDEAEENVSVAVERYIAVSDEITAAGAADISSMEALVSPEWWETERAGFSHFVENSLRTVGTSQVSRFLVQSARITPVAYHWSWGDGSDSVTTRAGSSWGAKQFSPTGTSHVYEQSGDYVVSLEVTLEAAYRFDGGAFQSLPGQITRSSGQRVVEVLSVTPVLVDKGCHSETLVSGRC